MISMLDLCSGKWEQEQMGGDYEWEALCTGWTPKSFERERLHVALAVHPLVPEPRTAMPADLLGGDVEAFLDRMVRAG